MAIVTYHTLFQLAIEDFFSVKVPATKGPSHPGIAPTALVIPRIVPEKFGAMSKGLQKTRSIVRLAKSLPM